MLYIITARANDPRLDDSEADWVTVALSGEAAFREVTDRIEAQEAETGEIVNYSCVAAEEIVTVGKAIAAFEKAGILLPPGGE